MTNASGSRTYVGDHDGATAFLRQEGCTVVIAGALLAEAEATGYERHQLTGRSVTVKTQGAAYYVRSSPSGLPAIPAHLR